MPGVDELRKRLVGKLGELFQVDRADLDFGIYRVLNQKRGEIEGYLQERLPARIAEALAAGGGERRVEVEQELKEAVKQLAGLGVDPETAPKVKELRQELERLSDGQAGDEGALYQHLLTFFSRYYDKGDFISKRRYKGDTYAIPYDGEEVKLYWANYDQYYIKSSETFRDYRFTLESGRAVYFRLVAAETAQANNKETDRHFVLVEPGTVTRTDEDGEAYEESLTPVQVQGDELVIHFHYKPDSRKAADRMAANVSTLLAAPELQDGPFRELASLRPTDKNPTRTLLEQKLADYTTRNTADYFIHKDLSGFLRRELDFYVKNEVMNLDDLGGGTDIAAIEGTLRLIQTLRAIGHDLIAFLAQLENFQKRLWLKKKFVTETQYCITLDRVPESLYPAIAANDAQRQEWVRLFAIDEIVAVESQDPLFAGETPGYSEPLSIEFLKANSALLIDTRFFDEAFRAALLRAIPDIDAQLDGLLIHSENYQALNLLQERYREQVKCIYIDPPYNTGSDGFPYKDNYQGSSWASMILDRLVLGRAFLTSLGTLTVSIDDDEVHRASVILLDLFGQKSCLARLVWDRNRKNDATYYSVGHEYMLVHSKNRQALKDAGIKFREPRNGISEAMEFYSSLRRKHSENWDQIQTEWRNFYNELPKKDPRKKIGRFKKVGPRGPYRDDGNINWPGGGGPTYDVVHPETGKVCKKPTSGWRYSTPERFQELYKIGHIVFGPDETTVPRVMSYLFEGEGQVMPSVFYSYAQTASNEFEDLFTESRLFDNPKNWKDLERIIRYMSNNEDIVLDYFAGSGSTGHAVINLNREDSGTRKYILVEMGGYFDTILKPRIQKVVYAKDWKDGKPVSRDSGVSHCFKYLRLESYEDTLNNLELGQTAPMQELFQSLPDSVKEEYLLHYMVDVESRGSLLSVGDFRKPFDYRLKIATDSVGETRWQPIDLVETFNYLIGLQVATMDRHVDEGYVLVEGETLGGERTLVIWRDCERMDYDSLDGICARLKINPRDSEYDVIYVNGDHNIVNTATLSEEEGGVAVGFKVRQIEDEFLARMFPPADSDLTEVTV